MESPEAKYFGSVSLDVSTSPEVWGLAYLDVYICSRVLARLRWKRWLLGVIGPRCTVADSLVGALEYIFFLSATIARTKPEFQLQGTQLDSTADYLSEEVRARVANVESNITSFLDLYPDLLSTICAAANLAPSIIATAIETEHGQKVLLGTKVPRGVALELAIDKAREGFIFGRMYSDLAESLGLTGLPASSRNKSQESAPRFDVEINGYVRDWEAQSSA